MLNNILMPINFGTGHWSGFYYSPFSVDSVQTYLAIVVGSVKLQLKTEGKPCLQIRKYYVKIYIVIFF